uniref:Ornithorhynchus venom defensin-like peptide A n=1 Tax=Ornithorhynchus anatinus TaxID=9258 RepID=DLPA_ORNAN|nr:RecName: Full=Ornithorhynchus venom defensin-like peptide A; Short=OvDLP-A; Flags: Precursor [Ornithorhynchus anatinus]
MRLTYLLLLLVAVLFQAGSGSAEPIFFYGRQPCSYYDGVCRDKSDVNCKYIAFTYCENPNQRCCYY